jgi:Fic family protein
MRFILLKNWHKKNESLNEFNIKQIHSLILKNIEDANKGTYRKTNVIISGAEHIPPQSFDVSFRMEHFINEYGVKRDILHPIELASFVSYRICGYSSIY